MIGSLRCLSLKRSFDFLDDRLDRRADVAGNLVCGEPAPFCMLMLEPDFKLYLFQRFASGRLFDDFSGFGRAARQTQLPISERFIINRRSCSSRMRSAAPTMRMERRPTDCPSWRM